MGKLENRMAVVTGAARGIGRGIAERLLTDGATVMLVDVLEEALSETAAELSEYGDRISTIAVDLTSPDSGATILAAAEKAMSRIDILVNNAGVGLGGRVEDFTDDQWNLSLAVNISAPFKLARAIVPTMAKRGFGRVINISSFAARAGMRGDCGYAVSKAGIEALTRSIAVDYGIHGVTCNAIAPGTIETPLMKSVFAGLDPRTPIIQITTTNKPIPGVGYPADIAAAVAFLASDDARFVTGHVLPVDGGVISTAFVPDPS